MLGINFRLTFATAEVDWFCSRTKKQGHRILVDSPLAKVILRIEDEIDSHAWYQTVSKAIEQHKLWLENNRETAVPIRLSSKTEQTQVSSSTKERSQNFRRKRTKTETNLFSKEDSSVTG